MSEVWNANPHLWHWLLLVHAASTWFMTGLIWFVQIVHYPLFGEVGTAAFTQYERVHQRRTTWVVAPLMLIELATSIVVAYAAFSAASVPTPPSERAAVAGLGLVVIIWASTWALQVPMHEVLAKGFERAPHRRLVLTNWLRTAAWSVRAVLAASML